MMDDFNLLYGNDEKVAAAVESSVGIFGGEVG